MAQGFTGFNGGYGGHPEDNTALRCEDVMRLLGKKPLHGRQFVTGMNDRAGLHMETQQAAMMSADPDSLFNHRLINGWGGLAIDHLKRRQNIHDAFHSQR